MTKNRTGYACINMTLAEQGIKVNRGMTQTYFLKNNRNEMMLELSKRIAANLTDLYEVLQWNAEHEIDFYRMSSVMFTLEHLYELEELPGWKSIQQMLQTIGGFATENDIRLSFHPGPFNVLASPKEHVVEKTIKQLNFQSRLMDEMGLSRTFFNPLNIHVGGAFGDKKAAMERFAKNWDLLDEGTKLRLNVENDDRPNMFSVKDLMYLHELIGIPICFDYLHHQFCHSNQPEKEALEMVHPTWSNITPVVHIASSIVIENDSHRMPRAHAAYLYEPFDNYGLNVDYMVEAKAKELALLKWKKDFKPNLILS